MQKFLYMSKIDCCYTEKTNRLPFHSAVLWLNYFSAIEKEFIAVIILRPFSIAPGGATTMLSIV